MAHPMRRERKPPAGVRPASGPAHTSTLIRYTTKWDTIGSPPRQAGWAAIWPASAGSVRGHPFQPTPEVHPSRRRVSARKTYSPG